MKTVLAVVLSFGCLALLAAPSSAEDTMPGMFTPTTIVWGDAPPVLPPGSKMAVLYGDPTKPGLFVLRAKFPPDYRIAAHWHPTDEVVTVISGTLQLGMGDQLDPAKVTGFPSGSLIVTPANMRHFVVTSDETVIEVASMGPFDLIYVNPADDPSKK